VRKIAVGVLVSLLASLALIAGCSLFRTRSGDEDSIRVKGGSIDVDTVAGIWTQDTGDEFTHNAPPKPPRERLWVMVHLIKRATCTGSGDTVVITHSDGADASFKQKGNGTPQNPYRTKVKLKNRTAAWRLATSAKLLYQTPGYIADVTVDGHRLKKDSTSEDCQLTETNLDYVAICSAGACQAP
jgi:hypothetical protein